MAAERETGLIKISTPAFSRDEFLLRNVRIRLGPQFRDALMPAISATVPAGSFWLGSIDLDVRKMTDEEMIMIPGRSRRLFAPDEWAMMMYGLLPASNGEQGPLVTGVAYGNLAYVRVDGVEISISAELMAQEDFCRIGAIPVKKEDWARSRKGRCLFYVLE